MYPVDLAGTQLTLMEINFRNCKPYVLETPKMLQIRYTPAPNVLLDDIDEAHELAPVHQVDHKGWSMLAVL